MSTTITAGSNGGGTVQLIGQEDGDEGRTVQIIATPQAGYRFKQWVIRSSIVAAPEAEPPAPEAPSPAAPVNPCENVQCDPGCTCIVNNNGTASCYCVEPPAPAPAPVSEFRICAEAGQIASQGQADDAGFREVCIYYQITTGTGGCGTECNSEYIGCDGQVGEFGDVFCCGDDGVGNDQICRQFKYYDCSVQEVAVGACDSLTSQCIDGQCVPITQPPSPVAPPPVEQCGGLGASCRDVGCCSGLICDAEQCINPGEAPPPANTTVGGTDADQISSPTGGTGGGGTGGGTEQQQFQI